MYYFHISTLKIPSILHGITSAWIFRLLSIVAGACVTGWIVSISAFCMCWWWMSVWLWLVRWTLNTTIMCYGLVRSVTWSERFGLWELVTYSDSRYWTRVSSSILPAHLSDQHTHRPLTWWHISVHTTRNLGHIFSVSEEILHNLHLTLIFDLRRARKATRNQSKIKCTAPTKQ